MSKLNYDQVQVGFNSSLSGQSLLHKYKSIAVGSDNKPCTAYCGHFLKCRHCYIPSFPAHHA